MEAIRPHSILILTICSSMYDSACCLVFLGAKYLLTIRILLFIPNRKQITLENSQISVIFDIVDTSGSAEYTMMRDAYIRHADAIMIVYSITDATSFEDASSCIEYVERQRDQEIREMPCIVVGNKVDLANKERAVTVSQGKELATKYGITFMECSAKTNFNIREAFEAVALATLSERGFNVQQLQGTNSSDTSSNSKNNSKCITM